MVSVARMRADNSAIMSKQGESVTIYSPSVTVDSTDFYVTDTSLGDGVASTGYIRDPSNYEIIESDGKIMPGDAIGYFKYDSGLTESSMIKVIFNSKLYAVRKVIAPDA